MANTDALPDPTCPPDASERHRMTPNTDPWQQKTREGKIQAGLLLPCVLASIYARLTASGFRSGPVSVAVGQAFLLPGFILAQASHVQRTHMHRLLCILRSAWFYANKADFWRLPLVSTFPPATGINTKLNAGTWTSTPSLTGISFSCKKSNLEFSEVSCWMKGSKTWREQEMHSSSKSDLALLHIFCFHDKFSPVLALLQNKGVKDDSVKGFWVCVWIVWISLVFQQNTAVNACYSKVYNNKIICIIRLEGLISLICTDIKSAHTQQFLEDDPLVLFEAHVTCH